MVLACIGLIGLLATAALAAATLGYEVGLSHPEPQVDVKHPEHRVGVNHSEEHRVGNNHPEEHRVEGRDRHKKAGHKRWYAEKVVAHPGPSVEEFGVEKIMWEDALWMHKEKQWREEEKKWRAKNAVNQTVFYMYRAQSSKDYPPVNINLADIGGVLWYLHHEIVCMTPRKYHVTRILRYKVTVKNTDVLRKAMHHDFAPFVAFDSGKCTVPTCDEIWNKWGFVVGCQVIGGDSAKYSRQVPCDSAQCHAGAWYSLPGPCPVMDYKSKSDGCKRGQPGGACSTSDVTGEAHCTYHAEEAGWVDMNEYTFIRNYSGFIEEGRREYDPQTDRGVRFSFWDGLQDQSKCNWRMNRLQLLFKKKFPDLPALLEPPACPR